MPVTYDDAIRYAYEWAEAYIDRDGSYTPGDLGHCSYRLYKEEWPQHLILLDIKKPGSVKWPLPVEPTPTPPAPSDGLVRAGFLLSEPYGYGYPGWADAQRQHYRAWMRGQGLRHLPIAPWCSDPRGSVYDYRGTPDTFTARVWELLADGITPIIMAYCGDHGAREWSRADLEQFWARYVRMLSLLPVEWCCGWEINDINEWTRNGDELGEWAKTLFRFTGRKVWLHWTPERWSGWPNFGDPSDERSEYHWWHTYHEATAGLLYQAPFDQPLEQALERAFKIPSPHGYRPGIAGRMVDGLGKKFVLFEFARDRQRWLQGVEACEHYAQQGLCHGWG